MISNDCILTTVSKLKFVNLSHRGMSQPLFSAVQTKWKALQDAAEISAELTEFTTRMQNWEFNQASLPFQKVAGQHTNVGVPTIKI